MQLTQFGLYAEKETEKTLDAELSMDFVIPLELIGNNTEKNWDKCGLIANFFGNYQAHSFKEKEKIESVISTIANELLENAIKFTADKNKLVNITLKKYKDEITLETVNLAKRKNVEDIHQLIESIQNNDIESLFLAQIEKNALNEKSSGSGVGIISIIKDYNAKLGIKIEPTIQEDIFDIYIKISLSESTLLDL